MHYIGAYAYHVTLFIIEIPKQLPIAFVVVKRNTLSEAVQDVIFYLTIQWVFRLIKRHSSYKDTDHLGFMYAIKVIFDHGWINTSEAVNIVL